MKQKLTGIFSGCTCEQLSVSKPCLVTQSVWQPRENRWHPASRVQSSGQYSEVKSKRAKPKNTKILKTPARNEDSGHNKNGNFSD
eukprot:1810583-Prymnesium_polylepis.3